MIINQNLSIKGMHCTSCVYSIEKSIRSIDGVISADASYASESLNLEYDSELVNINQLNSKLSPLGYTLTTLAETEKATKPKEKVLTYIFFSFITFFLVLFEVLQQIFGIQLTVIMASPFTEVVLAFTASIFIFSIGKKYLLAVVTFFQSRYANMNTLIGIGTSTAYFYSIITLASRLLDYQISIFTHMYFDAVIVILGFVELGKYLEKSSKTKTGEALRRLMTLQTKKALLETGNIVTETEISEIKVNDILLVKPGSQIPLDGVIVSGSSTIDESTITGESIPVDKGVGDKVIGATINKTGSLRIKVEKIGTNTMLSRIIELVEKAQSSKPPIQKLADRISSVFVPIVFVIAVISFTVWLVLGSPEMAINSFVGILVIACPCALGLSTPTAIIVGSGKGASLGILIKNAESLEKLAKVNYLVTDKTGTITTGVPRVTQVISEDPDKLLQIAASLEQHSEHPLAVAITNEAVSRSLVLENPLNFRNEAGLGISGEISDNTYYVGSVNYFKQIGLKIGGRQKELEVIASGGETPVLVADKTNILGIIGVSDTLKVGIDKAVDELNGMGIEVMLLSGDTHSSANKIALLAGIGNVKSQVLPNDKAYEIKRLQESGYIVAMVGDGINDSPALAQADVGIAMSNGTDIAMETSSITLLKGDFSKVVKAIKLSKATVTTIRENFFWAFIYNIIGIPLAAGILYPLFGITLNPAFAGIAMSLSSVSVVLNALRLKTRRL